MDLSHFDFRKTPFTPEIAVSERFPLPYQEEGVDGLLDAIKNRMCAVLIAPAGSGKTLVLRTLVERLPQARYHVRYVKITGLSKRDLCQEIAAVCGLPRAGTYPSLVTKLQTVFSDLKDTDGRQPVLVIDEAHE